MAFLPLLRSFLTLTLNQQMDLHRYCKFLHYLLVIPMVVLHYVDILCHLLCCKVWNSDVRFYAVKDSLNNPIAYFYFDPYSRPSEKRGGAWMDEVFARSCVLAHDGAPVRLPIAHMVCNQTPPFGNKPSLMTFREVIDILMVTVWVSLADYPASFLIFLIFVFTGYTYLE